MQDIVYEIEVLLYVYGVYQSGHVFVKPFLETFVVGEVGAEEYHGYLAITAVLIGGYGVGWHISVSEDELWALSAQFHVAEGIAQHLEASLLFVSQVPGEVEVVYIQVEAVATEGVFQSCVPLLIDFFLFVEGPNDENISLSLFFRVEFE
jgi:hypothetical protein